MRRVLEHRLASRSRDNDKWPHCITSRFEGDRMSCLLHPYLPRKHIIIAWSTAVATRLSFENDVSKVLTVRYLGPFVLSNVPY